MVRGRVRANHPSSPTVHTTAETAMISPHRAMRPIALALALAAGAVIGSDAAAQDADPIPVNKDTLFRFPNTIAGEFTPGTGYNVIATKFGSLNISMYGLFRYLNQ